MGFDRARYNTRRRVEVPVCRDLSLIDEHARLDALVLAESKDRDTLAGRPPSADALAEVEARMETEQDVFAVEPVGYQQWLRLQMDHPPVDREHRQYGFDPMTFPPAALAASCVDPELTLEDAVWLFEHLDAAQWEKLWDAVLDVNMGRGSNPKSLVLALLDRTSKNGSSGTAPSTESPRRSSPGAEDGPAQVSDSGTTTT